LKIPQGELAMKALIAGVLVIAFAMPALAADEFYVVQDVKTKKCKNLEKKQTKTTDTVQYQTIKKKQTKHQTRKNKDNDINST
jgi:uncharacterized membrane protein YciS (DUF1049 family)